VRAVDAPAPDDERRIYAMSDGSAAQYVVAYDPTDAGMERKGRKMVLRWEAIPWARIVVDTLLVAGILLASANFLSVR